jgi:N-acetylglucosaminyldiphosphoundecaprenol N-acetyl-beta-D-mannosaminyltransferase
MNRIKQLSKGRTTIDIPTVTFLGVGFSDIDLPDVLLQVAERSRATAFSYIVTPNVDHLVMLHGQKATPHYDRFVKAYAFADIVTCDSRTLARLARLSGLRLNVIPGSDLTAHLFTTGQLSGKVAAIVGGEAALVAKLARQFPNIEYRHHCPPMGVLQNADAMGDIVHFVIESRADVVLFAIGAPQSEIAAHQCRLAGARGVGMCVGASLEFLTAEKRRAPRWIQRSGFEWAFRLLSEPRRLWRRYLVEGPRIFGIWWRSERAQR